MFSDTCSQTGREGEFWKTENKQSSLWTRGSFKSKRLPESHFTTHYTVSTKKPSRCTANTESRVIKHDEIPLRALRDIPGTPRGNSSSALLKTPRARACAKCHPVQPLRANKCKTCLFLLQVKGSTVTIEVQTKLE